jgi:hypothetical protein
LEETDEAIAHQLTSRLQALQRAEGRLARAPPAVRSCAAGRYLPDHLAAARLGPSREPFQALNDPAAQDNPLIEDDETTFDEPPPERDPAMPAVPDGVPEDDIDPAPPGGPRRPGPVKSALAVAEVAPPGRWGAL